MDHLRWDEVDAIVRLALAEDVRAGDVTSRAIATGRETGQGQVIAKRPCVAAGVFMVERILREIDPGVAVQVHVGEGKKANVGTVLCSVVGRYAALLQGERTVLNFLQRLCGIATLSARFVRAVKGTNCRIYDTRKTGPGMRELDKYAVRTGGACNHRMGLHDAILIKENHIALAGSVTEALRRTRKMHGRMPVEIEVRNMEELVLAVEYGADIVLLDNMSVGEIAKAARLVGDRVELEISGGVTLSNVKQFAQSGASRISVGVLTHSAPAADLSMLVTLKKR